MTVHLHFHLGPAGGFIGEARRTRDYWAGSFLLSWLVGKAMAAARAVKKDRIVLPLVQEEIPSGGAGFVAWLVREIEGKKYSLDPTLAMIETPVASDGPFLGTLTNHFTAKFNDHEQAGKAGKAGEAAARAVREAWNTLADKVLEHVLDNFAYLKDEASEKRARDVWKAQIGDADRSPFWEIYWVVYKEQQGASPLESRKLTRWSPDMEAELPSEGNFCTMFAHFVDVSGLERRTDNQPFKVFWIKTRAHLNEARYGDRGKDMSDAACLDLRPNESLSAPALVKRLFPLLAIKHRDKLTDAIGWVPEIRNAMPAMFHELSWVERGRQALGAILGGEETPPASTVKRDRDLDTQSALYWPSTSYIAATHWIARAQRSAREECVKFEQELLAFAPQYVVAEYSLWLRAVHEPFEFVPPLAWVDGAMLHENRLERAEGGEESRRPMVMKALKAIRESCIEEIPPAYWRKGMKVGAPPSYYAIIRADGDNVGKRLAKAIRVGDEETWRGISSLFIKWAGEMRGKQGGSTSDEKLGPIAARNGIMLYAGADELLVFAPAEDAFDIARAIRKSFEDVREESGDSVKEITISVAVLYAHIRAPLRWAIKESETLLNRVAKDAAGRNALALALFDIDGARSRWAARWEKDAQIDAFGETLKSAVEKHDWLWSNAFYHRVADRLRSFVVPDRHADCVKLVKYLKGDGGGAGRPDATYSDIVEALIARCVAEQEGDPALAKQLFRLLTPFNPAPGASRDNAGHVTLAPLDILRVLGTNWRKDEDCYSPAASASRAPSPPP